MNTMSEGNTRDDVRSLWKLMGGSALLASMCCFPSVVLVLFGLASVSTAASLSDTLYWGTDGFWWFRGTLNVISLGCVIAGLVVYFRSQGICTLNDAKRQRNRVVNTSLVVLIVAIMSYLVFNYVILTEIGIALDLPWESSRFWT